MQKRLESSKKMESIYGRVREILETARSSAYRAVNFAMVQAYWNIGKVIVEDEQRGKSKAGYGEYLVKELSDRLTKEFGKGFDYSNVKNMRQFYLTFPIGDALRSQLSWTHYRLLMRVEKEPARDFYMDFYVRYFEEEVRQPEDNPTIGLILCAQKNEAIAKYTLLKDSKNIYAAKYKLYLPAEKELKEELEREKRLLEMELKLLKSKGKIGKRAVKVINHYGDEVLKVYDISKETR